MGLEGALEKLAYVITADPREAIGAFGSVGKSAAAAAREADASMASAKKRVEELSIQAAKAEQAAIRAEARATKAVGTNLGQSSAAEAEALRAKANRITGDLTTAKNAAAGLEQQAQKTGGALSSMGLIGAAGPAAIVAGVTAGTAALVDFGVHGVETFLDLTGQARQFQLVSKASAEDSSKFAFAARESGIGVDTLATGIFRLGKNVQAHRDILEADGIEIAKNKDGTVDLAATLANVAQRYVEATDGAQAAKIGSDALGRSFATLTPLLGRGKEALAFFFEEAKRSGQIFSEKDLTNADELRFSLKALHADVEGLEANAVRPFVKSLAEISFGIERVVHDVADAPSHMGPFGDFLRAIGPGLVTTLAPALPLLADLGKGEATAAEKAAAAATAADRFTAALQRQSDAEKSAYEAGLKLPEDALRLADAQEAVGAALRQQTADAEAVVVAKRGITDAERSATDAHVASVDADHKLAEAEDKLNEVRADTTAVAEELARAEYDLEQKTESHTSALLDQRKAQDAVNLLLKKGAGVDSLKLQEAQEKLAEANTKVGSSALDQADAAKTLDEKRAGHTQHAKDLAAAEDAVASASRGAESAHRSEVKAVEAIDTARRNYQTALQTQKDDERKLAEAVLAVRDAAKQAADDEAASTGQLTGIIGAETAKQIAYLQALAVAYPQVATIVAQAIADINKAQGGGADAGAASAPPGTPPPGFAPPVPIGGIAVGAVTGAPPPSASTAPFPGTKDTLYSREPPSTPQVQVTQYITTGDPKAAADESERKLMVAIPRYRG